MFVEKSERGEDIVDYQPPGPILSEREQDFSFFPKTLGLPQGTFRGRHTPVYDPHRER